MQQISRYKPLNRSFFTKSSIDVAKSLLGCIIVTNKNKQLTAGIIVETEAYPGQDPASHVFNGKITDRTKYQLLHGGHLYLYLIHGKHVMLSITTNKKDIADVVFIRSIEPIYGIDTMYIRRKTNTIKNLSNGPGKLSISLGITMKDQGKDILSKDSTIYIMKPKFKTSTSIVADRRINLGIHRRSYEEAQIAIERKWRFFIKDNEFISVQSKPL